MKLNLIGVAVFFVMLTACQVADKTVTNTPSMQDTQMSNPVFHFEIPITDMDRAIAFYQTVFEFELHREQVDGYEMAFFPRDDGRPGASGALAKGYVYKPSHSGTIVYFDVPDIDAVFARTIAAGSRILYEKTDLGAAGFVGEIEDSEGNRIALTQARE